MPALRTTHLVVAATVLTVAGLALIFLSADPSGSTGKGQQPAPEATALASPSPEAPAPPTQEHGETHEPDQVQMDRVDGFAQAFGARDPLRKWLVGVAPHVTPELLEGFRYTDPNRRLVGKVRKVVAVAELEHVFTVTYTSGARIMVTLEPRTIGGWVVGAVEPVKAPEQTGTDV